MSEFTSPKDNIAEFQKAGWDSGIGKWALRTELRKRWQSGEF